jgi:ankyrin repeat protein
MKNKIIITLLLSNSLSLVAMDAQNVRKQEANIYLITALEEGDADKISEALDQGADIELFDKFAQEKELQREQEPLYITQDDLDQNLFTALAIDDIKGAKKALRNGANPNRRDYNNQTPLHTAICKNNIEIVRDLISFGADTNAVDNESSTPLHISVQVNNPEIAHMLLRAKASTSAIYKKIYTPWVLSSYLKAEATKKVLSHHLLSQQDSATFLHYAAFEGDSKLLKSALKTSLNVNTANSLNQTALSCVLINNTDLVKKQECIEPLLKAGSAIRAEDIELAQQKQLATIVRLLECRAAQRNVHAAQVAFHQEGLRGGLYTKSIYGDNKVILPSEIKQLIIDWLKPI